MKICTKCSIEKPLSDFKKDKRNSLGVSGYCKECQRLIYPPKPNVKMKYPTLNTLEMIKMVESNQHYIDHNGIIYVEYQCGVKKVEKRIGSWGYFELKIKGKTYVYHQLIAKYLIPNPSNCNLVFFKNKDKFDLRPENLHWVWSRYNQRLTIEQVLKKTTDSRLIAYYITNKKEILNEAIIETINKMAKRCNPIRFKNLMSNLYLTTYNYAERCLLFNLEQDMLVTYIGLCRQEKRRRIQTVSLNENLHSMQKTSFSYSPD